MTRNKAGMYMKTNVLRSKHGNLVEKKDVNSCQATIVRWLQGGEGNPLAQTKQTCGCRFRLVSTLQT